MAKVIEEVKTHRTNIKAGDIVDCDKSNKIYIVTAIITADTQKYYEGVNLKTGAKSSRLGLDGDVRLHHGKITLENED